MPVGSGFAIGLFLAATTSRIIVSLLYQTAALDPAAIAVSLGLLVVATSVAGFLPAWSAARVDPMRVSRQE